MNTKKSKAEETRLRIAAVAASATEADQKQVDQIQAQARLGDYQSETVTIQPAAAALLFLNYNAHNRDWQGDWTLELLRREETGQWQLNGDTVCFYTDGQMADGQNRLAMFALSGKSQRIVIVYGVPRSALPTKDGGKVRHAYDSCRLDGIEDAVRKEQIVKKAASYLVRAGDADAALRSTTEIVRKINQDNEVLNQAIDLGLKSKINIVTPTLTDVNAQLVAYLMLTHDWPVVRIAEKLALFQSGVSAEGESAPFFQAAQLIERSRAATNRRERLSTTREIGVVLFAMLETERGTKAIPRQKFRDAVKKEVPSPKYPENPTEPHSEQAA